MGSDDMTETGLTGRWHPDRWRPLGAYPTYALLQVGQLVGWRYAVWQVVEVRPRDEADLTDEDRRFLAAYKPEARPGRWPYTLVLAHVRGPLLCEPGQRQRLHDGTITVHLGVPAGGVRHPVLPTRYLLCSCCGDPAPCLEEAREETAEAAGRRLDRLVASHTPGVCAGCRGPISSRQKTLTFPEPSLLVPGMPGPTFHTGRIDCWMQARAYELDHRLPAFPDAARMASCPGALFHHVVDDRYECTAERLCTGHHGPHRRASIPCYTWMLSARDRRSPRPVGSCAHPGCLGHDPDLSGNHPSVGDTFARGHGGISLE